MSTFCIIYFLFQVGNGTPPSSASSLVSGYGSGSITHHHGMQTAEDAWGSLTGRNGIPTGLTTNSYSSAAAAAAGLMGPVAPRHQFYSWY